MKCMKVWCRRACTDLRGEAQERQLPLACAHVCTVSRRARSVVRGERRARVCVCCRRRSDCARRACAGAPHTATLRAATLTCRTTNTSSNVPLIIIYLLYPLLLLS